VYNDVREMFYVCESETQFDFCATQLRLTLGRLYYYSSYAVICVWKITHSGARQQNSM